MSVPKQRQEDPKGMVSGVMGALLLGTPFVKFMEPFGTQECPKVCCGKVQTEGEGRIWGSPQSNEFPLCGGAPSCLGHSGGRMAEPDTPALAANAVPWVWLEGCRQGRVCSMVKWSVESQTGQVASGHPPPALGSGTPFQGRLFKHPDCSREIQGICCFSAYLGA